jgi:hypothetical protein
VSPFKSSSDCIGSTVNGVEYLYSVCHAPKLRKQWMLMVHTPGLANIAAYFRDEMDARTFAEVLGLTITDHA